MAGDHGAVGKAGLRRSEAEVRSEVRVRLRHT
jgi:hypothetical protein